MTFSIDQFRLENKVAIVTGAGGRGNSIGRAYALGLAGYAAIKVLTPCFYALNLPRTPLRISLIAIGVNLVTDALAQAAAGIDRTVDS